MDQHLAHGRRVDQPERGREDPHGAAADALLLSASVATLGAVVLGILKAGHSHGAEKSLLLVTGIGAIVASWAVVHTVFTLRYAALYYRGPDGGVDFNEDDKPTYVDFAYLAFTIGMTYQVSDTDLPPRPCATPPYATPCFPICSGPSSSRPRSSRGGTGQVEHVRYAGGTVTPDRRGPDANTVPPPDWNVLLDLLRLAPLRTGPDSTRRLSHYRRCRTGDLPGSVWLRRGRAAGGSAARVA